MAPEEHTLRNRVPMLNSRSSKIVTAYAGKASTRCQVRHMPRRWRPVDRGVGASTPGHRFFLGNGGWMAESGLNTMVCSSPLPPEYAPPFLTNDKCRSCSLSTYTQARAHGTRFTQRKRLQLPNFSKKPYSK